LTSRVPLDHSTIGPTSSAHGETFGQQNRAWTSREQSWLDWIDCA